MPQTLTFNTNMTRNYHELQTRDINNLSGESEIPLNFSQQFYWDRSFSIKWDPTTNLRMNLSTGTNAEIEEPYLPVNKKRYPNEYEIWKDSVKMSISSMGRPLTYQQNFSASYNLPLNKLPIFEWVSSVEGKFTSSYNWARGNSISGRNYGNDIANRRNLNLSGSFQFEKLYNLIPYLEETNKRFASKKNTGKKSPAKNKRDAKKKKAKPFTKEIQLYEDSTLTVKHNLKSKKFTLTARTKKGKPYKLKYKIIDDNSI